MDYSEGDTEKCPGKGKEGETDHNGKPATDRTASVSGFTPVFPYGVLYLCRRFYQMVEQFPG